MLSHQQHAALLRRATTAALCTALILVAAKAFAWWQSGSVSLLAGLTDSLLDSAASLLNLMAVRYALRPADDDHRFGHGKAEALAGLGQAVFVGISALVVAMQALQRLEHPEPVGAAGLAISVMVLSLAMTAALLLYQRYVVRLTGSTAVRADSLHYRSDLLLNTSILLALVLSAYGWENLDPLFGLGISAYILWSALSIVREATGALMDQALPPKINAHLEQLVLSVEQIQGVQALRTRTSGAQWFVQLEVLVDGHLSLTQAHRLCHQVEQAITAVYPRTQVLVHAEPSS